MKSIRGAIAWALVAVFLIGLPSAAFAQQPASPPAPAVPAALAPVVPVVPAPPGVVVEVVTPEPAPHVVGRDIYDVGAGVATVARVPLVAALCGLGASLGTVLFVLTFGSSYRASTRVIEEGCAQKWILTGDDLRPRGAPGIFGERPTDPYRSRR